MDLLELNDVYCHDRARVKHDKLFDEIRIEYPFIPTEDSVFSAGMVRPLDCIINHPFRGSKSVCFTHDLSEYSNVVNDIPVTTWYDADGDNGKGLEHWSKDEDREWYYDWLHDIVCQNHPDILFSDMLPGITMAMSAVRNPNRYFERTVDSVPRVTPLYTSKNGVDMDGCAMSLIYVPENGAKRFGYGPIIYFGRGLVSLPYEMKVYLLSSTYLICRHSGMEDEGWEHMRTSCMILYEDSLNKIVNVLEREKETE